MASYDRYFAGDLADYTVDEADIVANTKSLTQVK